MQKEYLIELGDAVVAVKDNNGDIKLNQLINTTTAGAVTGAFWGSSRRVNTLHLAQVRVDAGCQDRLAMLLVAE